MSYYTPGGTMSQIAGSSLGQPSASYSPVAGEISSADEKRRVAKAYAAQPSFQRADIAGAMRRQDPVLFSVNNPVPGMVPTEAQVSPEYNQSSSADFRMLPGITTNAMSSAMMTPPTLRMVMPFIPAAPPYSPPPPPVEPPPPVAPPPPDPPKGGGGDDDDHDPTEDTTSSTYDPAAAAAKRAYMASMEKAATRASEFTGTPTGGSAARAAKSARAAASRAAIAAAKAKSKGPHGGGRGYGRGGSVEADYGDVGGGGEFGGGDSSGGGDGGGWT